MEPVTFQFTPTPQDYAAAARAFDPHRKLWIVLGLASIIGLLLLLGVPLALLASGVQGSALPPVLWSGMPVFVIVLLVPPFIAGNHVAWPFQMARRAARDERMRAETTYRVDDDAVIVGDKYGDTRFEWGSFGKVLETPEQYLLIYAENRRKLQIVPKRAFGAVGSEEAFRGLVRRHVGAYEERA